MNLFAEGTKNNPNDQAQREQEDFQAYQQTENEKLAKAEAEFIASRAALMATMTEEEWETYLHAKAVENAKEFKGTPMKGYELR